MKTCPCHYENMPMQYTENFFCSKNSKFHCNFFLYFCSKHRLWVHVRTASCRSTHNLCFGEKIRKIGIPLHIPLLLQRGYSYMYLMATFGEHNENMPTQYTTPQPLYNTIVGVQDNFRVSYPVRKIYTYIAKSDHLGSMNDPCYIQNCAVMNRVIKRSRCI